MSSGELTDFILFIFEQKNDDELWAMWLAKDMEVSFKDFKKENQQKLRMKPVVITSDEEADKNIDFANQFVKPRKENE